MSTLNPQIDEVKIDGKIYVPKNSQIEHTGEIKIVVLQRGWVYVGRFEKDGQNCKLHNASCIRVWGTSKGLPELVDGITTLTKLDRCAGVVEFNELTIVFTITVNQDKWKVLL